MGTGTESGIDPSSEARVAAEAIPEEGWYGEIELRRFLKDRYQGSDYDIWTKPNLERAQWYRPFEENESHEELLRETPLLDVYDDRIIVGLDTVRALTYKEGAGDWDMGEFGREIVDFVAATMAICEDNRRKHIGHGRDYDGKYDSFQNYPNVYFDEE
jgi:hypothetical protein